MTNENTQNQASKTENGETNRPDYIAKQYRVIRIEDGWRTRKERIGVVFKNDNGSMTFRPSGAQFIEGDVHFFPTEEPNNNPQ
ncbi:MAG: hypothetical protein AB2551_10990 [Candidatus Thiodiazotropha sp.]